MKKCEPHAIFKDKFSVLCLSVFVVSHDIEYYFLFIFNVGRREQKSQAWMEFADKCLGLTCFFFMISSNCDLETSKLPPRSQWAHAIKNKTKKKQTRLIIVFLCCWMNLFCSNTVAVTARNLFLLNMGHITTSLSEYTFCVGRHQKLCVHRLLV